MAVVATRIVSGFYKGRPLCVPEGSSVRPTLSRCRKSLFDILGSRFPSGVRGEMIFADIFAGSGAVGLEAVSLGFGKSIFVENATESLSCLQQNLAMAGDSVELFKCDAFQPPKANQAVDILFFDPPYDMAESKWQILLETYDKQGWIKNSLIILQYGVGCIPTLPSAFAMTEERVIGKSAFGFIFA